MMRVNLDVRDVVAVKIDSGKLDRGNKAWVSVTAVGEDGKETEFTFWAVESKSLPVVIGEE